MATAAAAASSWGIQHCAFGGDRKHKICKAIPDQSCSYSSREGSLESEVCFSSPLQEDHASSSNFAGGSSSMELHHPHPVNLLSDQEWISFLKWKSWQIESSASAPNLPSSNLSQLDFSGLDFDPSSSLPANYHSPHYSHHSLSPSPYFDPSAATPLSCNSLYNACYEDPFLVAFANSTQHQGFDLPGKKNDNVDHAGNNYNDHALVSGNYPGIILSSSWEQGEKEKETKTKPSSSSSISDHSANRSSVVDGRNHKKKRPLPQQDAEDQASRKNNKRMVTSSGATTSSSSPWELAAAAAAAAACTQQPPIIEIADRDHEGRNNHHHHHLILQQISAASSYNADSSCSSSKPRIPALNTNLKPRARQGSANDPQSIAARHRRERISDRLKILQELVPNSTKVDLVTMLEKAINYVKFLQLQVKVLTSDDYWPAGKADAAL